MLTQILFSEMKGIPYGKQHITDIDIEAVIAVLKSDYLTQGPTIRAFEEAFASYVGAKFAVAVSNGTAALHLSCLALGVKPGQKVITTPITFAASANCVRYCGAEVVFADIDANSFLLDIANVRALLENAPRGTYAGIIPVDFAGLAVNLEAYRRLAEEYGLWIIEDACHAPGGAFMDSAGATQKCGNGTFADLSIFSFHPVKHIATGEGGMITTNSRALYENLLMLRTHGITRDSVQFEVKPSLTNDNQEEYYPDWYMEMQELGYNYRMTDIQAALGISQLKRADEGLIRRREIAKRYEAAFFQHEFVSPQIARFDPLLDGHAYHLYVIRTQRRLDLYNYLRRNGIYPQVHYIPCHLMPYYRRLGWKEGDLPKAESYYKECLSLPIFPTLHVRELELVINTIQDFFS